MLVRCNPASPQWREIHDAPAMTVPLRHGFELGQPAANTTLQRLVVVKDPNAIFGRNVPPRQGGLTLEVP